MNAIDTTNDDSSHHHQRNHIDGHWDSFESLDIHNIQILDDDDDDDDDEMLVDFFLNN